MEIHGHGGDESTQKVKCAGSLVSEIQRKDSACFGGGGGGKLVEMGMTREQVLDLYFMEARSKLIDLAAFLDRVDRGDGAADFRLEAWRRAVAELQSTEPGRAKRVLIGLSDPTSEPLAAATTKGAAGAWPGTK
jgi:hypothetical protein